MIFRDVQLLNYGSDGEEKLSQNRLLMDYWENVRDIFCINLPEKLDLAGISKVNIRLGKFDGPEYEAPSSDGIATFRRSDFAFDNFCSLSDLEKQTQSLFYIEDSLMKVCHTLKVSDETVRAIRSAADTAREHNFECRRVHKKTTKWNQSRNLRAVTELHHKRGGIDADLSILDKQRELMQKFKLIEGRIWEAVWFDLWNGCWQGTNFVIEDRVGNVFYTAEVSSRSVT